jgi:hypothetical protein
MTSTSAKPPAAASPKDKTVLYGLLGIITGGPAPVVGILLGVQSISEARRVGKSIGLGVAAIAVSVLGTIGLTVYWLVIRK